MSVLPRFETRIRCVETRAHAAIVFDNFIHSFTREDLFLAAEAYVRERAPNGSVYAFRNMEGGLMGLVVNLVVQNTVGSVAAEEVVWLNRKLMEHYEFTAESIPPRMLVREAVALRVRLDTVLADLERELASEHPNLPAMVAKAARELGHPEEAYLMSDEEAGEVIRRAL